VAQDFYGPRTGCPLCHAIATSSKHWRKLAYIKHWAQPVAWSCVSSTSIRLLRQRTGQWTVYCDSLTPVDLPVATIFCHCPLHHFLMSSF